MNVKQGDNRECLNTMNRDRHSEVANQAASTLLNINRDYYCSVISSGISPPDIPKDKEGYFTVSYHFAGVDSAYVTQNRLRKKYPNLDTKVVNVHDLPVKWKAEVRVKLHE